MLKREELGVRGEEQMIFPLAEINLHRHSRVGGNPITFAAPTLDSRLRGNDD